MVSEAVARSRVPSARALGWTAAACIGVSLVVMLLMALNGPSVTVPTMPHPSAGPPWWHPLHLSDRTVLLSLWAASVVATVGVLAGLAAVAKGARAPIRLLIGIAFGVVVLFMILPPAGSSDTVSYAIDGSMVVAGHSPYVMTPQGFAAAGGAIAHYSSPTWWGALSDYGPLATASEWLAAKLGGNSVAQITFWLKLWTALSFVSVSLLLDWLLRSDSAKRLRAHLLWTLNPIMLWEIVASGHIDGLAIAFGLGGIGLLWKRRESDPPVWQSAVAGALIGAAISVKLPFAVYAIGAAWFLRDRLRQLAAAAVGCLLILVPSFAIAGKASISVYFKRGNSVTWDNLYQVFWRPFNLAASYEPNHLVTVAAIFTLAVAALLIWKLPQGLPTWPTVRPSLALSLAWIFMWPFQRPWYDVMIIGLLVLFPASRLDWVVLFRLGFAAITYMDAVTLPYGGLAQLQHVEGEWVTSTARLLSVLALVWLCITGRWGLPSSPAQEKLHTDLWTPAVDKL
jgi:hypothetical protein